MLLAPGAIAEIDIKKLLIDRTTAIAYVVKQCTHDLGLESLNTVSASTMRNSENRHYEFAFIYNSNDSSVRRN